MTWHVWVDGSCQHGVPQVAKGVLGWGGWAAIVEHGSDGIVLRGRVPETTNTRMEIQAAIEGLSLVPDGDPVVLHTDCTTLIVIRDWLPRIGSYTGADSRLWREFAAHLRRVDVTIDLLGKGSRDAIHKRAHAIAGAEARGGLRNLPANASVAPVSKRTQRRRRRKAVAGLHRVNGVTTVGQAYERAQLRKFVHHRDCIAGMCVACCPVWLEHGVCVYALPVSR